MDLGGTVCTSRRAHCDECPLSDICQWRGDSGVADPARSSAGVSRPQAQFEGSRRQARGLLLKRLGQGAVQLAEVPDIVNRSPAQAYEVVDGLVKDGLCVLDSDSLRLP